MDIVCEACGGTDHEPTPYQNVMGTGANLIRCRSCGLKFYDHAFDVIAFNCSAESDKIAEDTARFGSMDNRDPAQIAFCRESHRAYYGQMLDILTANVVSLNTLYEVGCGVGEFSGLAKERGITVAGCEPNRRAAALAFENWGVPVEPVFFYNATIPDGLDAVIMLDVIEHTATPRADLEKAFAHLRPGGGLLLKTFYDECHAGGMFRGKPLDLTYQGWNGNHGYFGPPSHLFHFDESVLLALIERVGFRVAQTVREAEWGQIGIYAVKP